MADDTFDFQSTLDSFTRGTLSLINSRNQIRSALDTKDSAPAGTRTDAPTSSGTNTLLLVIAGFVVFKVLAK